MIAAYTKRWALEGHTLTFLVARNEYTKATGSLSCDSLAHHFWWLVIDCKLVCASRLFFPNYLPDLRMDALKY